jgi:hypothetical protein
MSDDEEKVDGEINPDLLEAGLDDEPVLDGDDLGEEDEFASLDDLADKEDEEGLVADGFDDEDKW